MNALIITIFVISLITLGIILTRVLDYLIIDIIYMKASEKTKKEQEKEIERLKELNTMYINKINNLYQYIKGEKKNIL